MVPLFNRQADADGRQTAPLTSVRPSVRPRLSLARSLCLLLFRNLGLSLFNSLARSNVASPQRSPPARPSVCPLRSLHFLQSSRRRHPGCRGLMSAGRWQLQSSSSLRSLRQSICRVNWTKHQERQSVNTEKPSKKSKQALSVRGLLAKSGIPNKCL